MINGVRVENGSVISTVGTMSVTGSSQLRVVVDGQEWTPTSREGNTQFFSLTVGGRIMIFDDNKLAFSAYNNYEGDFRVHHSEVVFYSSEGSIPPNATAFGTYVQANFKEGTVRIMNAVYPVSMGDAQDLQASANQTGATVSKSIQSNWIRIDVSEIDVTQPLEVYLGNVLVAYLLPN